MTRKIVIDMLAGNIEEIHRRFSVKTLAVFGSIVRNEADEKSDIDVLVEFDGRANFDGFMDLKFYLEDLLGMGVDLVTDKALRPQVRCSIEQEKIRVA